MWYDNAWKLVTWPKGPLLPPLIVSDGCCEFWLQLPAALHKQPLCRREDIFVPWPSAPSWLAVSGKTGNPIFNRFNLKVGPQRRFQHVSLSITSYILLLTFTNDSSLTIAWTELHAYFLSYSTELTNTEFKNRSSMLTTYRLVREIRACKLNIHTWFLSG